MNLYVIPIVLVIFSNIIYNISQKNIDKDINPFISLIVTYAVGIIFSFVLYFFSARNTNIIKEISHVNIPVILLGLAIVGLEVGFLLAYRMGWNMSTAVIVANTIATIILVPIGIIFFREKFNLFEGIGIAFCIIGIVCISIKK